jgi:hypothetical protein
VNVPTHDDYEIIYFEGTCDVCGGLITFAWDRRRVAVMDYSPEAGGLAVRVRHYATAPEGADPNCAIYGSKVREVRREPSPELTAEEEAEQAWWAERRADA